MDATLMETLQSRLNLKQIERDQKRVGFFIFKSLLDFVKKRARTTTYRVFLFIVLSKLKHVTGVRT